ncbi:MAG: hypothetical protein QW303_00145 [Nitrososphaerota archaeon]
MLQLRPISGTVPSRLFYSPARDLAHCGDALMMISMRTLDDALAKNEAVKEFLIHNNIKESELMDGIDKLGLLYKKLHLGEQFNSALHTSGFVNVAFPIKSLILMFVGDTLLRAIATAVKDVSTPETVPPVTVDQLMSEIEKVRNAIKR